MRPYIASYLGWTKFSKFSTLSGHVIKWLLTNFCQAGRENIWLSVMTHRPRCAQSVYHDLEPNIFSMPSIWIIFIISMCAYFPFGSFYSRERKNTSASLIRHQVHLQPQHYLPWLQTYVLPVGLPGLISTSPLGSQCGLASSTAFFISPMFKDQLFSSSK